MWGLRIDILCTKFSKKQTIKFLFYLSAFQVFMDTVTQELSHLGKSCQGFIDKEERHKTINYMLKKTRLCDRSEFCFSALRGPVFPPGLGWICNEVYLHDFVNSSFCSHSLSWEDSRKNLTMLTEVVNYTSQRLE